ncbi:MAG: ClpP family protease [Lachnospiraceae bacterium]
MSNDLDRQERQGEQIKEFGQVLLDGKKQIQLMTIIGEIEGHENLSSNSKTTKYEHLLPKLAMIENDSEIDGLLLIVNSIGGDCSAGLALAEMIASLSKPTVSLVIGDSHSIALPLAVSTNYSYIVPTATVIIHPVRMNGMVVGAQPTYNYFKMIQDRIVHFLSDHAVDINPVEIEELMMETGMLTRDVGTVLVGEEAVRAGILNEVGGIKEAMNKLYELMESH